MRIFILLINLLFITFVSKGQSLSQEVISPSGAYIEMGLFSLSYTVAQTATQTVNTGNNILTEGFQQPEDFFTGIKEIKINEVLISVYPNPSTDFIHINIKKDKEEVFYLQVFSMVGSEVTGKITVTSNTDNVISLLSFVPGTYMVKVTCAQFTKSVKFVKTGN